jgi:hypothetical protein
MQTPDFSGVFFMQIFEVYCASQTTAKIMKGNIMQHPQKNRGCKF